MSIDMSLKLELFSGEERSQKFIDDLGSLLALDDAKIDLIVRHAADFATSHDENLLDSLERELNTSSTQVGKYLSLLTKVAARVLSGRDTPEVIDDLASNNLPKQRIEHLFSAITRLDDTEKRQLRAWSIARELDTNHIHSLYTEVAIRGLTDKGNLVGAVPHLYIRMGIWRADRRRDETVTLDLMSVEIQSLLETLKNGQKELETATARMKSNPNEMLAVWV
jgi:hypothetical protein